MNKNVKNVFKALIISTGVVGGIAFVSDFIQKQHNKKSKIVLLSNKHKEKGIYEKYIKRPLDAMISWNALIILSPFLLGIGGIVRAKLGSPVFFVQKRAGLDEKIFKMIKFRTMTDERNENGDLLPDEERFTSLGNFLRKSSIDELPELLNVLNGDMSLIGPRPLYTYYVPYYTKEEAMRHSVRGGITGLAQINGRAIKPIEDRLKYDLQYVDNITFINDLKIFLMTIVKVLKADDVGQPTIDDAKCLNEVRTVQRPEKVKEFND